MGLDQQLASFLRKEIMRDDDPANYFVLRHAAQGSKGAFVDDFVKPADAGVECVDMLVADISMRAQNDADGNGGTNRYSVTAYPRKGDKSGARFTFRLSGGEDEFSGAGEESANEKGMISQAWRHIEALAKVQTYAMPSIMSTLVRRFESQDELIAKLISQRQADLQTIEQAESRKHDREMERLDMESAQKRKDALVEKFSILIPVIIAKFTGRKLNADDDPAALMLKEFVQTLEPAQFQKILAALNPEQGIALITMLQGFRDKEDAKQLADGDKTKTALTTVK